MRRICIFSHILAEILVRIRYFFYELRKNNNNGMF